MPRELTDVPWTVAFKDGHHAEVAAAYPTTNESGVIASESGVLWLKDANHKVVFAAPLAEIRYVRRGEGRFPGDAADRAARGRLSMNQAEAAQQASEPPGDGLLSECRVEVTQIHDRYYAKLLHLATGVGAVAEAASRAAATEDALAYLRDALDHRGNLR